MSSESSPPSHSSSGTPPPQPQQPQRKRSDSYSSQTGTYKIEEIPILNASDSMIAALYGRIENLLSLKSGLNLSQLEIDPLFVAAKAQLSKLADSEYLDEIVICTINILDSINRYDSNVPLVERNLSSLRSIASILNLLTTMLNDVWDNAKPETDISSSKVSPMKDPYEMFGITAPQSSLNGRKFRTGKPRRIDTKVVKYFLTLLAKIKTEDAIINTMSEISSSQVSFDKPTTKSILADDFRAATLISKIDSSCEQIVKYLASSNETDFLEFLRNKFRRINIELMFIPCSDFLGLAYLTSSSITHYLTLVRDIIQITRRQSQQNVLLTFFSESIYSWIISRTSDYLKATKDPLVTAKADSLFELAFKLIDFKLHYKSGYRFLSLLLVLLPKQFEKFLADKRSKPSTLAIKRTVGKTNIKQKYMYELIQLLQKAPTAASSLINVMLVSCSISIFQENHPIVQFSHEIYDQLYKDLSIDNPDYYPAHVDSQVVDNLRMEFYATATMLHPRQMTRRTISAFEDPNTPTSHLVAVSGGIRKLMEIPLMSQNIFPYLEEASPYMLVAFRRLATIVVPNCEESDDHSIASDDSYGSMMDIMDVLHQNTTPSNYPKKNNTSITNSTNSISSSSISTFNSIINKANKESNSSNNASNSNKSAQALSSHQLPKLNTDTLSSGNQTLKNLYRSTSMSVKSPFKHSSSHVSSTSTATVPTSALSSPTSSSSNKLLSPAIETRTSSSSSSQISHSSSSSTPKKQSGNSPRSPLVPNPLPHTVSASSTATSSSLSSSSTTSTNSPLSNRASGSFDEPPIKYVRRKSDVLDSTKLVLINLLQIYRAFPFLCFYPIPEDMYLPTFEATFNHFISPIINLIADSDPALFDATRSFILSFIVTGANVDIMKVAIAYLASAILIDNIAKLSISSTISQLKRGKILTLLARYFERRQFFFKFNLLDPSIPGIALYHANGGCSRLVQNLEKCIFLGLFSDKIDIHRFSRSLLRAYNDIITGSHHLKSCFESHNADLARAILSDKVPPGTMAARKKLRDHLCSLISFSDTLIEVWILMYEKLAQTRDFAGFVAKTNDVSADINITVSKTTSSHSESNINDGNDTNRPVDNSSRDHYEDKHDSEDYGEYVASLGGIILSPEFADDPRKPGLEEKLALFLNYKMTNLFSADARRKERSREVLCVSMHPFLCGIYLDLLAKNIPRFETALRAKEYHMCELMVNVLRTVSLVDYVSLYFYVYEFWELNLKILKLLNMDLNDAAFLRLKLKFCKMQGSFLARMADLSMHGNITKKNEYARIVASYLEDSFHYKKDRSGDISTKVIQIGESSNSERKKKLEDLRNQEVEDLHFDIKVETSVILKIVFFKLPLDTSSYSSHSSNDDKLTTELAFSNYFNLFVRILEQLNSDNKKYKDTNMANKRRSENIIKNIIQALINLLKSNTQVGLKYSLPLGYHEDSLIRVSFINVFSSIVKDLSIQMTSDRDEENSELLNYSMNILANDPLMLLSSVQACPTSEVDAFANALLGVTEDKEKDLAILLSLIKADILSTTDSVEILRSNTVATRMVALYSHTEAAQYLIDIFRPIFNQLIDSEEYFETEKLGNCDQTTTEKNLQLLMKYLDLVVDAICNSVEAMPIGLRLISQTIYETTAITFPESKFAALGAFIFLRLFNPAIVAPERANITDYNHPPFKRSLMQIARILQGMANETTLSRLPLLQTQADYLMKVKSKISHFMANVVKLDAPRLDQMNVTQTDYNISNYQKGYMFFHAFFHDHWLKIRQIYSAPSQIYDVPLEEKFIVIRAIDNILSELGLPKRIKGYEIPENIKNDKTERGIQLYDFMSGISLADYQFKPFVKESITKDGLPLIIIDSLLFPEGVTPEVICYQIFQSLSKYWDAPYCELVDCTSYNVDTLIGKATDLFDNLVPDKYKMNCKRYYYYNVSLRFYQTLKSYKYFSNELGIQFDTEYIFLSFNDDQKSLAKNGLINYTNSVSKDSRVSFSDASLYQEEFKRFVPVKLKIGNEFLQIYSSQPQRIKVCNSMKLIYPLDCYRINEIEDLHASAISGVANEISMLDSKTDFRVILTSPKKIEIMRTLYFSRSRFATDDMFIENENEDEESLESSVGQLININLSGLLSRRDDIRNASFILLTSVCRSFGLSAGKKIESVGGMTFPYGDVEYIFSISSNLARNHPSLTYDFLTGFFRALDAASEDDKSAIVIYTAPWIKNIYQHVLVADPIKGYKRTSELIRKFVRASRGSKDTAVAFSMYIWSHLSLEDDLVETIIDEIIAAAIDHEAEGHDWEDITKYWPITPTVEICGLLIRRLREKSYAILTGESEIEAHTRWIEITVLARFLSYLVFDSLIFVEMYLSDIFYIVTIYMDYGPLEFRNCILQLIVRTFHAFLSKDGLSEHQRESIREKITQLNGARFRMLFGLTRDDKKMGLNSSVGAEMVNKSHSVATVTEMLTGFLDEFSDPEDRDLLLVKWNSYVLSVAFSHNAQLQGRAILVLGSLTKEGVGYNVTSKFLKTLIDIHAEFVSAPITVSKRTMSMAVCVLHSFTKVIEGLPRNTLFVPHFFWFSFNLATSKNVVYYQYGLKLIKATVIKISKELENSDVSVFDYLFEHRKVFGSAIVDCEASEGITVIREYFDVLLANMISKGISIPFISNTSFDCLKTLLRIRYREEMQKSRTCEKADLSFTSYLFYLYAMVQNDTELGNTLNVCGLKDLELITLSGDIKAPKLLLDFFTGQDIPAVYASAYGASSFFNTQSGDEIVVSRCLRLYDVIIGQSPKVAWSVFEMSSAFFKKLVASSSSVSLIETIMNIITKMLLNPEYKNRKVHHSELLRNLRETGMGGLETWSFTSLNPFDVDSVPKPILDSERKKGSMLKSLLEKVYDAYIEERES